MLRSALELHKEVLQGLQTVDAFSQDMFLPEEIDLHLNKQQDSFLNELLDAGFADRQLRLDYVQDVIVKNKVLPIYISPSAFYYEGGAVVSTLPGGYKHMLPIRAKVREVVDCAALLETMIDYTQVFHFVELSTNLTTPDFFSKVELIRMNAGGSETIVATVSMPVKEKEDTYLIVKNLLYQANKESRDKEFYWEKYSGSLQQAIIKPNHIIIKDDSITAPTTVRGYKIKTYKTDDSVDKETFETFLSTEVKVWNIAILADLAVANTTSVVLLDNKEIYERRQNVFFFPKPEEPHAGISDGLLFTYYGSDFLVEEVTVDYIREPQPISISLEQGCELSESASRIIADRTIEYLKLLIENPNYREMLGHNEIRGQN